MSEKFFLTQEQLDALKTELHELIYVLQPKNAEDIEAARAQGDLSENAEYDAAKEEQAKLKALEVELKKKINNAVLIKQNDNTDFVEIGHAVTIESLDDRKVETFKLLGQGDGKVTLSVDSPLGKALLGKATGDSFMIDVRAGELRYKVIDIK